MQRSSLGDEQALWVCRLAPSVTYKVWAWQWKHWRKGGKPKPYCLCLLTCRELSVSSPGGLVGTRWCSPIFGDLHRAQICLFLLSHRKLHLLWSFYLRFLCACPTSPMRCPCLLWCGKQITWAVFCTHKCGTAVVKGCACLNLRTTGAVGCSCALSADSDKEGVMFLIPECEKTLYQQGHERERELHSCLPSIPPRDD